MARWEPDARGRLAEAAMALYAEQGYDATSVAQIAERAGLTERTFFRHFADKREVLFDATDTLEHVVVAAVTDAPPGAAPLQAVAEGIAAAGEVFDVDRHGYAQQRQAVVAATPALQERELIKMARLTSAVTDALLARGVTDPVAGLAAESGVAVFRVAFAQWVAAEHRPFADVVAASFAALGDLAARPVDA